MRGSQLDRRVTFQSQGTDSDAGYGPQPGTWTTVHARVPAQVLDSLPSKSESDKDGLRVASRPARLRIRYMPGLTSAMRIVLHDDVDRTMLITSGPAEIGRREWLEFMVEEYSS